uniref:Uncharacterized protein n=1 Tax=Cacopsylla melanoneura TaxID=428564 RepID=A0A8D8QJN3_9HEMI
MRQQCSTFWNPIKDKSNLKSRVQRFRKLVSSGIGNRNSKKLINSGKKCISKTKNDIRNQCDHVLMTNTPIIEAGNRIEAIFLEGPVIYNRSDFYKFLLLLIHR